MDFKIFLTTFATIFVAELADKTQLAGITLSAKSGKPLAVLLGSVSAYILITAISVLLGATLGKYIRPEIVKYTCATLFVIVGILMLWGKI